MSLADDLKNLDPNNPGLWPLPVQIAAFAVVFILILFGGYKLDISKQLEEITKLESKEQELKNTYETKQKKVANLDKLKEQMKEMEQSFGDMLRQLPNRTEVDALIVDISQEGLSAGLEFDLFKPGGEQPSEFYAELPINISVKGEYHQLGEFVSGIAALPRIVTIHNITISKSGDRLSMSAIAKTYRALDEEG
ncbi:MAG: pilus assembly protein PilO [Gammaproteobacteria bacterium]|nr:pilus assembly protein PilO [Gammaproteobacteria bacterium]